MPRPRADKSARRAELASAAALVFAERGVANTAVSDIVKAAGVAQGTFYLYFDSKDDVILAVVEQIADTMIARIEAAVDATGPSAAEKLRGLSDILMSFEEDPAIVDLAETLHTPHNAALHDRLEERLSPSLVPLVERIVAQGIAEGAFDVPDAHTAAWFVLGGLRSAELSGTGVGDMPAQILAVTELALRALGYRDETQSR